MNEKGKLSKYSGADWLENDLKCIKSDMKISPLGRAVANLLGELFLGIYHIDSKALERVDWSNNHHIVISIGWKNWSTFDFDALTRLVFLAHHACLRVDLDAATHNYVKLMFHQRSRKGDISQRHPTLAEAVKRFQENVTFEEYNDAMQDNAVHTGETDIKSIANLLLTDPINGRQLGIASLPTDNSDGSYSILCTEPGSHHVWKHTIRTEEVN